MGGTIFNDVRVEASTSGVPVVGRPLAEARRAQAAAGERLRLSPRTLKARVVAADLLALCVGVAATFAIQGAVRPVPGRIAIDHLLLVGASFPMFALGAFCNRLYIARANERRLEEARNLFRAVAVGVGAIVVLATIVKFDELSRMWLALLALCVGTAALVERFLVRRAFARLRRNRSLRRRILIVGTDAHGVGLLHAFQRSPELGYEVVGMVGEDDLGVREGVGVVGPVEELEDLLARHEAVGVVVSQPGVEAAAVNRLTRRLTDAGYHVALSSSLHDIAIERLRTQALDGHTMLYVEPVLRGGWRAIAKRAFDIVGACAILVVSLPVLAAAVVAVKLTSPGPVLFRQVRVGRNGRPIEVLKLRSMVTDAEAQLDNLRHLNEAGGVLFKMKHDPRVTPVGRILRKLSIDELPQLWCVVRGDMSLVGPRPMLPGEADRLDPVVRFERLRVLPGLTGLWQVSGRAEAESDNCRLDRYYVDNWTLKHDVRICVRTIGVVVSGRGAS